MASSKVVIGGEDDQFIDIEITSSHSNLFLTTSPPNPKQDHQFEFQMPSSSSSPADLLFYKGKLLPLDHLLLHHHQNSNFLTTENDCAFEESSCNNVVSPSGSCRFSSSAVKLDTLDDFESDCSEKYSTHDDDHVNVMKSTKRIMKNSSNSSLGKKLRAWLGKASCKYYEAYHHHHHHVTKVADEASVSKANRLSGQSNYYNNNGKIVGKKNPFGQIHDHHRSSHSRRFQSSSSLFSGHPNRSYDGYYCEEVVVEQYYPKGNYYNNSEIGNSIQAAIAHCKQSHQCFN